MEEIPAFKWNEHELKHSSRAIRLIGLQQSFRGSDGRDLVVNGGGHATPNQNAGVWRVNGEGVLDLAFVSWTDARASRQRRLTLTAPPASSSAVFVAENNVGSPSFAAICTKTGEIFCIPNVFDAENSTSLEPVTNIGMAPTACCWSQFDSKSVACWLGFDSGVASCLKFSLQGKMLSTINFDPVTGPIGWLSAFSGGKKAPVLSLAVSPVRGDRVCALYADGRARLLVVAQEKPVLSEICPVFQPADSNHRWQIGHILASSERNQLAFVAHVVSAHDEPNQAPVMVRWKDDLTFEMNQVALPILSGDMTSLASDLRGIAVFNHRSISVHWNENQRKAVVCLATESLEDRDPRVLEFLVKPAARNLTLAEALERLVGAFSSSQITYSVSRTFNGMSYEDACRIFDESNDKKKPYLEMLRTNLQRACGVDREIFGVFPGFAPFSMCTIVRREGLSLLLPKLSVSSTELQTFSLKPENVIGHAVQQLKDILLLHEEDDRLQLLIGPKELAEMARSTNFTASQLASKSHVVKYIETFFSSVTQGYAPSPSLVEGSTRQINAVIMGGLLRKQSFDVALQCLVFALSLYAVTATDTEGECNAGVERATALARDAYRTSRCLSRVNLFDSETRQRKANPIMVAPHLLDLNDTERATVSLSAFRLFRHEGMSPALFENLQQQEESNLLWAWGQFLGRTDALGAVDDTSAGFWSTLRARLFWLFAPRDLSKLTSISWLLLIRPGDYATHLKPISASVLEEASDGGGERIFSIMMGCAWLWDAIVTSKVASFLEAKHHLTRGTPQEPEMRAVYFSECARLFEGGSPTTAMVFLRNAQLFTGEPRTEAQQGLRRDLLARTFATALATGDFLEGFTCIARLSEGNREGKMVQLTQAILSKRAFDELLSLPVEQYPRDLLPICAKTLAETCKTRFDLGELLAVYAFLVHHKMFLSAAQLSFFHARQDHCTREQKLETVNLCLAACAMIPERSFSFVASGKVLFYRDVMRYHALLKAQTALQACLDESGARNSIESDAGKLFEQVVKWLPEHVSLASLRQEELIIATAALGQVYRMHFSKRAALFQMLGASYSRAPLFIDRVLRTLIHHSTSAVNGDVPERVRFARCALEVTLGADPSRISTWWEEFFEKAKHLDVFVDILSDNGRWRYATYLAQNLVPAGRGEAILPVRVLDKVICRAKRYKFSPQEQGFVVDVRTEDDKIELDEDVAALEERLKQFFAVMKGRDQIY